ncbi:hypothetical protein [Bartonella sp. ML70XJBT.G]|uniref:hypothetical protein n=1 Tax=Bartonella sp. ML70XJBT.G TaxID=3019093 RepID=UPI002360A0E2|nr:hypothetical protein [Bartonella sp. ML70XJBT.G]
MMAADKKDVVKVSFLPQMKVSLERAKTFVISCSLPFILSFTALYFFLQRFFTPVRKNHFGQISSPKTQYFYEKGNCVF